MEANLYINKIYNKNDKKHVINKGNFKDSYDGLCLL